MPSTYQLAGAPKAAMDAYYGAKQQMLDAGKSDVEANAHAGRMIRHAGWFKVPSGWKQLTPDLRKKINVREATRQPSGRYVVEGVDCFYPNATKDKNLSFHPEDNYDLIENTNRSIAQGGQKPCLVVGHTSDEQRMIGIQLDGHGFGVNWRESPRGRGWMRCDLIDVDPETVDRMKELKLPGLSIKIISDPTGLNKRVGHIALLGGSMQALSHLPITEIFSATNQLCFSADSAAFPKGTPMFGPKMKDCHGAYATAYAAFEAAEESCKTGEPGSVEKLRSAQNGLASALKALAAQTSEGKDGKADAAYEGEGMGGGMGMEGAAPTAAAPTEGAPVDPGAAPAYSNEDIDGIVAEFSSDTGRPDVAFAALAKIVKNERAEKGRLAANLKHVTRIAAGVAGKLLQADFSSEVATLERAGHTLPDKEAIAAEFSACVESKDPRASITRFLKTLKSLPKRPSPASVGAVFDNSAAGEASAEFSSDAEINASLARVTGMLGSTSLSEQDIALGRNLR